MSSSVFSWSILAAHWRVVGIWLWRRWMISQCFRRRIFCPRMNKYVCLTKRLTSISACFYLMSVKGVWAGYVRSGQGYFIWWAKPSMSRDSCLLFLILTSQDFCRTVLHHYFCHRSSFCNAFWCELQQRPSFVTPTQRVRSLVFMSAHCRANQSAQFRCLGVFYWCYVQLILWLTTGWWRYWPVVLISFSSKWKHW